MPSKNPSRSNNRFEPKWEACCIFSRTLHGPELKHSPVEIEASAIIEAVKHWKHFLTNHHFTPKNDQKPVSFMFDKTKRGKIKNVKIHLWRTELSYFSFDNIYRPGKTNIPADTFTRVYCSLISLSSLFELHKT